MEALAVPAARRGREGPLRAGLDALGDDVHVQAAAQRRDGLHDRGALRVARHAAQERAVHLQHVDRQLPQAREGGVLRPEVASTARSRPVVRSCTGW